MPLILPSVGVGWFAYTFLVQAAPRSVRAARVYAGPYASQNKASVRIVAVESLKGLTRPLAGQTIEVYVPGTPEPVGEAFTDHLGIAEVSLRLPKSSTASLATIDVFAQSAASGRSLLAHASLQNLSHGWQDVQPEPALVRGHSTGRIALEVRATPPVFAVPYPGTLHLIVSEPSGELRLHLIGAEFLSRDGSTSPASHVTPDSNGLASVRLRPNSHAIELTIDAANNSLHFYGAIPVVPGAMIVQSAADSVRVLSPIVRETAYLHFVTRSERLGGAVVLLTANTSGQATGSVPLPEQVQITREKQPTWAVVSSELGRLSGGAVGWPLGKQERRGPQGTPGSKIFAPRELLAGDGLPAALEREKARQTRARHNGAQGALAVFLALGFVLVQRLRGRTKSSIF